MNWRDFLTAEERARLDQIKVETRDLKAEQHRIYDRCRKRMEREVNSKTLGKTTSETTQKRGVR